MNEKNRRENWTIINPNVNNAAEFLEITSDFGNPLEIIREAISNSIDWGASFIKINFEVKKYKGVNRLFISFIDDGSGMSYDVLSNDFWGLGFSRSRGEKEKIGEKGHGTKIYLRSEKVHVFSKTKDGLYESYCDNPLGSLSEGKMHSPQIRIADSIPPEMATLETGTYITIIGYNDNERSSFSQDIVRDYILWFTKVGSIEKEFDIFKNDKFTVFLKCLDQENFEEIKYGHVFPEVNDDINKLFDIYDIQAADHYVKKFVLQDENLEKFPEVKYDLVIYIEGDDIKKKYNPMIRTRSDKSKGTYRVSDRYGLWLCKDFIPIKRVNDWVTSFGSGSNAYVLLHGFLNCQEFKLTANRGDISNTDPNILSELQKAVEKYIHYIDIFLNTQGVYLLREQQNIERTIEQEKSEYERRVKEIKKRKQKKYKDLFLFEPKNESELFGLFITLSCIAPDIFNFIPCDYNTSKGIDIIAKNLNADGIIENEYAYVELKYLLRKDFNHAFKYLRWIICWDFSSEINDSINFSGIKEDTPRNLEILENQDGSISYFLVGKGRVHKIEVIRLKELIKKKLLLDFN
ncbi:MAG: hypothetical protein GYA51_00540 [Candidatus Methanofastidiosa archaeon]|nr:hypothetical protein [Candidatus Methanofastidiosa archaeon]